MVRKRPSKRRPKSVAVSPTSTLRQPAASSVKVKDKRGVTVKRSAKPQIDLKSVSAQRAGQEPAKTVLPQSVNRPTSTLDPSQSDLQTKSPTNAPVEAPNSKGPPTSLGGAETGEQEPLVDSPFMRKVISGMDQVDDFLGTGEQPDPKTGITNFDTPIISGLTGGTIAKGLMKIEAMWAVGKTNDAIRTSIGIINNKWGIKNTKWVRSIARGQLEEASKLGKVGTTGLPEVGTSIIDKVATNTKTQRTFMMSVLKKAYKSKALPWIIASAVGSFGINQWLRWDNMITTVGFSQQDAIKAGDMESAAELDRVIDDLGNQGLLSQLEDALPWTIAKRGKQYVDLVKLRKDLSLHLSDFKAGVDDANQQTQEDYWNRKFAEADERRAQEAADTLALTDEINRRKQEAEEKKLKTLSDYWDKVARDQQESASSQNTYWNNYYPALGEARTNMEGSSKLNFGLL